MQTCINAHCKLTKRFWERITQKLQTTSILLLLYPKLLESSTKHLI